eukprot:gene5118-5358_t
MDFEDWDDYDAKYDHVVVEQPSGLKEVFEKFPKWFQEGYRGKGHEVRDLRRLLELYQRWQPRVFNHGSYNQFEQAVEKMSGTHAVKLKARACEELQVDAAAGRVPVELDDDELLELQQQAVEEAAEAAVPEVFEDFDEHDPVETRTAVTAAPQGGGAAATGCFASNMVISQKRTARAHLDGHNDGRPLYSAACLSPFKYL